MILFQEHQIKAICLSKLHESKLIEHCFRKLDCNYLDGETREQKAYGLIGGKVVGETLSVELIAPLYQNSRTDGLDKEYMDNVLDQYAVPSETPLPQRGWVADAIETRDILKDCQQQGIQLVGTYHMHRVSWRGDEQREKPTELDNELAKDTELFMFIISVIDRKKPVIRAFYEGDPDQELPIISVEQQTAV